MRSWWAPADLVDRDPTPGPPPGDADPPPVLRAHQLEKRYGSHAVLRGLDLCVREGEVYGFLGRNGAGKTTAIRAIVGIHRPDAGHIELFGEPATRPSSAQRQRIGYVSQDDHFYPWMSCRRIGEFVGSFYPSWDAGEYERLLDAFDLPPRRKVHALSHGMRIKLALALALAHRPRLLLLDEPTSGLDAAARREFLETVLEATRPERPTTLFSSHIVEEVERVADRIGILHHGRMSYEGPVARLRDSVRRVRASDAALLLGDALSSRFQLVSEDLRGGERRLVLAAEPEVWAAEGRGLQAQELSLEDIFLALTVHRERAE